MLNAPPSFPQLADWFSEQFSTAVLILPFILTLTLPSALSGFASPAAAGAGAGPVNCAWRGGRRRGQHYLPVTGFDLGAAVRHPLPLTCLLTFLTGIGEILLVANSLIHFSPDARMQPWQLFSTRLGIAAMLISPVIVAHPVSKRLTRW